MPSALRRSTKAQPAHVVLNRLRILIAFLFRVGVVEAQVALAVVVFCQAEIQADGFGVTDMQIAVRLGRKAGLYRAVLAARKIRIDNRANEIRDWRGRNRCIAAHGSRNIYD